METVTAEGGFQHIIDNSEMNTYLCTMLPLRNVGRLAAAARACAMATTEAPQCASVPWLRHRTHVQWGSRRLVAGTALAANRKPPKRSKALRPSGAGI